MSKVLQVRSSDVWVVVAALNEATRIGASVSSLTACGWNVVVVDDGSHDATAKEATRAGAVVLRHMINRGQGAALQTGIDFALAQHAKYVVTFDADGQHSCRDIPEMLNHLASGHADIVLGSRFLGEAINMPVHRYWLLKAATLFTRLTTRLKLTDTHNGLRAMTASTAKRLQISEDRMAHASEILHAVAHLRLRYIEHPVTIQYHASTLAKGQRSSEALGVLKRLVISRLFT